MLWFLIAPFPSSSQLRRSMVAFQLRSWRAPSATQASMANQSVSASLSLLHEAARTGDANTVAASLQLLVPQFGWEVCSNRDSASGWTPVHWACYSGNVGWRRLFCCWESLSLVCLPAASKSPTSWELLSSPHLAVVFPHELSHFFLDHTPVRVSKLHWRKKGTPGRKTGKRDWMSKEQVAQGNGGRRARTRTNKGNSNSSNENNFHNYNNDKDKSQKASRCCIIRSQRAPQLPRLKLNFCILKSVVKDLTDDFCSFVRQILCLQYLIPSHLDGASAHMLVNAATIVDGLSPAHLSAASGSVGCLKWLLQWSCNLNVKVTLTFLSAANFSNFLQPRIKFLKSRYLTC